MDIQGYSPLPQPANVFTLEEYQAFLAKYREMSQARWDRQRPDAERQMLHRQVLSMEQTYHHRLPVYLLARCPLCGGRVWEAVDTFSLNGMGWRSGNGFGWRGGGWNQQAQKYLCTFTAECEHAQFMTFSVNLNGLTPTDVYALGTRGPERPFVLQHFGQFKAVIHALPIGRYDDTTLIPRYTVYFVTYFTAVADALRRAIVTGDPSDGGRAFFYHEADYNLQRRVEKGQLYWLDPTSPDLPLTNSPLESFPYSDVQGIAEGTWLEDGMLESMSAMQKRQAEESARQQQEKGPSEGGLMSFLKGLFGPKDQ